MRPGKYRNKEPNDRKPASFFEKDRGKDLFEPGRKPFFNPPAIQAKPVAETAGGKEQSEALADKVVESAGSTSGSSQSAVTATSPAQPNAAVHNASGQFIVEDSETPSPMQMRKSDLIARLKTEVCTTVDEALAGTPFSSDNCPYIRAAFAKHQNSSPQQLEQLIQRYAPATLQATNASQLIEFMKQRVFTAAKQWAQSGGNPESIPAPFANITGGISSFAGGLFFKADTAGAQATQSPVSVMQSLGKGKPLDSHSKSKLGAVTGISMGDVEIHTDTTAARLSDDMKARAFTVGNHIAFANGQHKPGTIEGDVLMAHELAHVRQQSAMNGVKPKDGAADRALEEDADASAANAVMEMNNGKGGLLERLRKGRGRLKTGLSIQRCPGCSTNKYVPKTNEEILAYLTEINTPSAKIRGTEDGRQIAREAIQLWKTGGPAAVFTLNAKLNAIRELTAGKTPDTDQLLILDLIEQSEVVHVKRLTENAEINTIVSSKFSEANKLRFEAIKTGRAKEKDTSGPSFRSDYVKELIDEAYANALRAKGEAGRHECIGTVRNISIMKLYKHLSAEEQKRIDSVIDIECKDSNTMLEAMNGLIKAGYAGNKITVNFNKAPQEIDVQLDKKARTVKFMSSQFPGTLDGSVWAHIQSRVKDKEGWHAFGLGIMDGFHSVVLLVNVRPGGPFLYFVDQTNRAGGDTTHRLPSTIAGTQQFPPSKLDSYLEHYAHVNYPSYLQLLINNKEGAGKVVKEENLSRMQPNSQMDLWPFSKTKIK